MITQVDKNIGFDEETQTFRYLPQGGPMLIAASAIGQAVFARRSRMPAPHAVTPPTSPNPTVSSYVSSQPAKAAARPIERRVQAPQSTPRRAPIARPQQQVTEADVRALVQRVDRLVALKGSKPVAARSSRPDYADAMDAAMGLSSGTNATRVERSGSALVFHHDDQRTPGVAARVSTAPSKTSGAATKRRPGDGLTDQQRQLLDSAFGVAQRGPVYRDERGQTCFSAVAERDRPTKRRPHDAA